MPEPQKQLHVPVEEIERRIRWPALPVFLFLSFMLGLGVVALLGTRLHSRPLSGVPDDPYARRAVDLVRGTVDLEPGMLRFGSACTGELPRRSRSSRATGVSPEDPSRLCVVFSRRSDPDDRRVQGAVDLFERAIARDPREPRLVAALATLDLVQGALDRAERGYRRALDRAPGYGEARLGLGMVFASHADQSADPRKQRRFRLRAIAQCAAVTPEDSVYAIALYDRILLLAGVGRQKEARRLAARYRATFPGDPWGRSLDGLIDAVP